MTEDSQDMLEELLELTKENNRLLRAMHRSMIWTRVFNFVYWILIIGSAIGAFYFIQPYVDQFRSLVDTADKTVNSLKSIGVPVKK